MYHPEKLSSSAAVTHVSGCSLEQKTVDSSSDALSEVPEPTATRRKRRPGLNSKSVSLTDDEVLSAINSKEADKLQKEAEKEARKIQREQKKERTRAKKRKDKQLRKKGQTHNKQAKRQNLKLYFTATFSKHVW